MGDEILIRNTLNLISIEGLCGAEGATCEYLRDLSFGGDFVLIQLVDPSNRVTKSPSLWRPRTDCFVLRYWA